jgi:cysteine-rich repeat protein
MKLGTGQRDCLARWRTPVFELVLVIPFLSACGESEAAREAASSSDPLRHGFHPPPHSSHSPHGHSHHAHDPHSHHPHGHPPDGGAGGAGGTNAGHENGGGDEAGGALGGEGGEGGTTGGEGSNATLQWLGPCHPKKLSEDGKTVLASEGVWRQGTTGFEPLPEAEPGRTQTAVALSGDGRVIYGTLAPLADGRNGIFRFTAEEGNHKLVREDGSSLDVYQNALATDRDGDILVGIAANEYGDVFTWSPESGVSYPTPRGGGPTYTDDGHWVPGPEGEFITGDGMATAVLSSDGSTSAFTSDVGLPAISSPHEVQVLGPGTPASYPTAISGDGRFVAQYFTNFGGATQFGDTFSRMEAPAVLYLSADAFSSAVNQRVDGLNFDGSAAVGQEYYGNSGERAPVGTFYWSRAKGIAFASEVLAAHGIFVDILQETPSGISADGRTVLGQATHRLADGSSRSECFVATFGEESAPPPDAALESPPSSCGNGNVDAGEVCDDGNANESDACTNRCRRPVVSAGTRSTCALGDGGSVTCWGDGSAALISGETSGASRPVSVPSLLGAVQVASGNDHACALIGDGSVRCWGENSYGQLGDGTTLSRPIPAPVPGLGNVTQIVAGQHHSCALAADGSVRCWGNTTTTFQSDPDEEPASVDESSLTPVVVAGVTAVELAAGPNSTCARSADGTVSCWALFGERHDAPELAGAQHIALGETLTCGVIDAGNVTCIPSTFRWVDSLPPSITTWSFSYPAPGDIRWPTGFDFSAEVAQLALGDEHLCARFTNGSIACVGWNDQGQLGDGNHHLTLEPRPVIGIANATYLAAGAGHTCAALETGELRCWGLADAGQLGVGFIYTNYPRGFSTPLRIRFP